MNGLPLVATTQVDVVAVTVASAYGGAGALVSNSTDSKEVLLINTGNETIEYKVDAGPWVRLDVRTTVPLAISLATAALRLRMAQFARVGAAQLDITSLTGDYAVGDDAVELGGGAGGGATAFTELTDAPPAITPYSLVVGNQDGTALEFATSSVNVYGVAASGAAHQGAIFGAYNEVDPQGANVRLTTNADPVSDIGVAVFQLDVTSSLKNAQTFSVALNATGADVYLVLSKSSDTALIFEGFDTPATDTNARLTVGESSLGITKAIQVKIGADTHYWPLFGGEDAGPAPAPSVSTVQGAPSVTSDAGGAVSMNAGDNNGTGTGGAVSITSGFGGTDSDGGQIEITAGNGTGTGLGGNVLIQGGGSEGLGYGEVHVRAGAININSTPAIATQEVVAVNAGTLTFTHGLLTGFADPSLHVNLVAGDSADNNGGQVLLQAGAGATGFNGGPIFITGGSATGANDAGGNVDIVGGPSAAGTQGSVNLSASAISINGTPAVATQEVLVVGVGTMTFTHGLLTGFTPV